MPPPHLLDQMRESLRVKHHSLRTEESHLQWIRRFILFHNKKHPREMGAVQVEAFLSHLATDARVRRGKSSSCGSAPPHPAQPCIHR